MFRPVFSLIKSFVLLMLVMLLMPAASAPAQTAALYVIDQLQVGVRRGPGSDFATLDVIRTGDKVGFLGESGDKQWARIMTANNREGWVLRRYLAETPPASLLLRESSLQEGVEVASLVESLRQENEQNKAALHNSEIKRQELEIRLQRLSSDCSSASALRESLDQAQQQLKDQEQALHLLQTENRALNFTSNLRWFLAGGCVLLVGWLIGWLFGRRKRGSTYSGRLRD